MTTNFLSKAIAGAAIAAMVLPMAASAHGLDLKLKGDANVRASVGNRIEKALDRIEHKGDHEKDKVERQQKQATTTAAKITVKANRIQAAADTMTSFNARIGTLIASSSAATQAALNAQFTTFKTAAANAKVEAGNAIAGSAQVNATNSTTTNTSLLAAAKVDLGQAKDFLIDAQQALFSLLRSLWK